MPSHSTQYREAFSEQERSIIAAYFQPLGSISADSMLLSSDPSSVGNLVGHLTKEEVRFLGYRLLSLGDRLVEQDPGLLSRHFYFAARGGYYYRWRNHDDFALDEAIVSFTRQIELSEAVSALFKSNSDWPSVPAHAGFRQLRIIEEKRGNLRRAIELCETAKKDGWSDDWDKHLARLHKRLDKRA